MTKKEKQGIFNQFERDLQKIKYDFQLNTSEAVRIFEEEAKQFREDTLIDINTKEKNPIDCLVEHDQKLFVLFNQFFEVNNKFYLEYQKQKADNYNYYCDVMEGKIKWEK